MEFFNVYESHLSMPVYYLHTYTRPSTFIRDRNIFGILYRQTDHIFSDRNDVPIKKFGYSDGIGIFSEFRSEFATKLISIGVIFQ